MTTGRKAWRRAVTPAVVRPREIHVLTVPEELYSNFGNDIALSDEIYRELMGHVNDRRIVTFARDGRNFSRVTMLDETGTPSALSDEFEHVDPDSITEVEVVRELNAYGVMASTAALAAQNRQLLRITRALLPRLTAS